MQTIINRLNSLAGKFFKNKVVLKVTAYLCLSSAISMVLSSVLAMFQYWGFFQSVDLAYIIGREIFGFGFVSIFAMGYIVFRHNLCNWSKLSWHTIVLYHAVFWLFPSPTIWGALVLNSVLLFLVIFAITDLINVRFKAIKADVSG